MEETLSFTNTYTKQLWIADQARERSFLDLRIKGDNPFERTCQVRNRMREICTSGSVGGEARQRPRLPGPNCVVRRRILTPKNRKISMG